MLILLPCLLTHFYTSQGTSLASGIAFSAVRNIYTNNRYTIMNLQKDITSRWDFLAAMGNAVVGISKQGDMSVIAGSLSNKGYKENHSGKQSLFDATWGLAQLGDDQQTIIVSDVHNHCLRTISRVNQQGTTALYSGNCTQVGNKEGTLADARYKFPTGLTLSPNDSLIYVAVETTIMVVDRNANRVARLVKDLAARPDEILLLSDTIFLLVHNGVMKIKEDRTTEWIVGTASGGNVDGVGTASRFNSPHGLNQLNDSFLIIADSDNNQVRLVDLKTTTVTSATGTSSNFQDPMSIVLDVNDTIYLACSSGIKAFHYQLTVTDDDELQSARIQQTTGEVKQKSTQSPDEVQCEALPCTAPLVCEPRQELYQLNAQVQYDCEKGYDLQGELKNECILSGNQTRRKAPVWRHSKTPECVVSESKCGDPPKVPHAQVKPSSNTKGMTVVYSCEEGFVLSSDAIYLSCEKSRMDQRYKWQGDIPECQMSLLRILLIVGICLFALLLITIVLIICTRLYQKRNLSKSCLHFLCDEKINNSVEEINVPGTFDGYETPVSSSRENWGLLQASSETDLSEHPYETVDYESLDAISAANIPYGVEETQA